MNKNLKDQLKQIISEELDVNLKLNEISEDISLFEDGLGLDSVAIVEFICLIEDRYRFQFSDEELAMGPFKNLITLSELIAKKITTDIS